MRMDPKRATRKAFYRQREADLIASGDLDAPVLTDGAPPAVAPEGKAKKTKAEA